MSQSGIRQLDLGDVAIAEIQKDRYLVTGSELAIVRGPIENAAYHSFFPVGVALRNLYAAGSGFCSTGAHPAGFSAWLTRYATTPAAMRIRAKANELIFHTCSCSLRTIEKPSSSIGGMATAIAPNKPPGTRNGRGRSGSRKRSTARAANASMRLMPQRRS